MKKPMNKLLSTSLILLLLSLFAQANVSLPVLVSDGMVLQRDTKLIIWGWASPREKIFIILLSSGL